jgi:hypothetical protein
MNIVKIEYLHCDAGWGVNSFLKITTEDGQRNTAKSRPSSRPLSISIAVISTDSG